MNRNDKSSRRTVLCAFSAAATISLAGCSSSNSPAGSGSSESSDPTETASPPATPTEEPTPTAEPTPEPEADIEVLSFGGDDEVEIGENARLTAEVTNTGDRMGDWRDTLQQREDGEWVDLFDTDVNLNPGETRTWASGEWSSSYQVAQHYRLKDAGLEHTVNFVAARQSFGEFFEAPTGMSFAVDSVDLRDSYEWEGASGTSYREEAPSGKQFAFVNVRAENTGSERTYTPSPRDVSIIVDNTQYDYAYLSRDEGKYDAGEIAPGIVREGWIGYEVPASMSVSDMRISWFGETYYGDWTAVWTDE